MNCWSTYRKRDIPTPLLYRLEGELLCWVLQPQILQSHQMMIPQSASGDNTICVFY
ncbi:unnamed protein product, partial [Vitis vinifera]